MSGLFGGSQQVVQKTTSEPPAYAKPGLTKVANTTGTMFDNGTIQNAYAPSSLPSYIGPTAQETQGLSQIQNIAQGPNALSGGLLGNLDSLRGIISGKNAIDVPEIGANNANVMAALNTAAGQARDNVNGIFSANGRYGSGAHQGTLGDTVGNIFSTGLMNQYNQDQQAREQAQAANLANQANAAGVYGQLAPGANDSQYWNAQKLIDVGAANRGEQQQQTADINAREQQQRMAPLEAINYYNNILSGMMSGQGTQTVSQPKGSPIAGLLGGLATGGGILGKL
jgi:hypothetical protein